MPKPIHGQLHTTGKGVRLPVSKQSLAASHRSLYTSLTDLSLFHFPGQVEWICTYCNWEI